MSVGLTITRTIAAPPERVFAAWTRPEDFSVWFGGNAVDVPTESVLMDVRVDGRWTAVMHVPDGSEIYWHGRYTEVDPPRRLAFTMDDDPASDTLEPVVVTFAPAAGGTEMRLTQPRDDLTNEQLAQTLLGYNSFFDTMEILLAGRD
ncbi:SRPBCC domain-containing protein [Cryobacterium lactosi]|uniref:SRPBCC domain-containing protein n=1 Tax=Cryobacterium lactosi TaxID=1259202 RepID=A0A4R9BXV3_9MICO|nr:SRPBCC domain-containing protein [Cryobacterium lactosi]TFD93269.1 SRPBCC domain-containing protein [Cryobacterium lactosi]